jgi:hypothetical protein
MWFYISDLGSGVYGNAAKNLFWQMESILPISQAALFFGQSQFS